MHNKQKPPNFTKNNRNKDSVLHLDRNGASWGLTAQFATLQASGIVTRHERKVYKAELEREKEYLMGELKPPKRD